MKKAFNIVLAIVNLFLLVYLLWTIKNNPEAHFSGKDITDLLGVLVSCISILITIIFVVLAINAYGRIREIEKNAEDSEKSASAAKESSEVANEQVRVIKEASDSATQSLQRIGDANKSFYESTLEFIDMVGRSNSNKSTKERNQKLRKDMERNLYRMGLHPFFLDDTTRESFILNLSILGDKSDIPSLKKISESKTESVKIRNAAETVLKALKDKYPK